MWNNWLNETLWPISSEQKEQRQENPLTAQKQPIAQILTRDKWDSQLKIPNNKAINTLKSSWFNDEEIITLLTYSGSSSYNFLNDILSILKNNSKVYETIKSHSTYYHKEHKKNVSITDNINIEDIEINREETWKNYQLLKKIIFETIEKFEYDKIYFVKYVESKFKLISEFNLSDDEIELILDALNKYELDSTIAEKTAFMKAIYTYLSKWKIQKSDILNGIDRIDNETIEKAKIEKEKYKERSYDKIGIFLDLVRNRISLRRQKIIKRGIPKDILNNRLEFTDIKSKSFYLYEINSILDGKRWNIDINIDDIQNVINFFSTLPEEYKRYNVWIAKLNPTCIFNYLIIKKNRNKISNNVYNFINNKDKPTSYYFPNVIFLWNNDDILRKLMQIALYEKKPNQTWKNIGEKTTTPISWNTTPTTKWAPNHAKDWRDTLKNLMEKYLQE